MAMQRWLKKLFGRAETPASTPTEAKAYLPAKWLEANDRGDPFGVPLLDLMELQRMVSRSRNAENKPKRAALSDSWVAEP
jgi:hypothetical protein